METFKTILAYAFIAAVIATPVLLVIIIRTIRGWKAIRPAIEDAAAKAKAVADKAHDAPSMLWVAAAAAVVLTISANSVAVHVSQEKAVQKRHIAIAAQIEKARSIQATGKFEAAKEAWLLADRMGGDPGECLVRAAECCLYRCEYDEALELCQAANSRSPNCGMAFHVRGLVYQMLGDKDKAKEQYQIGKAYGCRASHLILGGKGA